MAKRIAKMKQLFCRHEWQEERVYGFLVKDGWLEQPIIHRCKKCGKVKND